MKAKTYLAITEGEDEETIPDEIQVFDRSPISAIY
jgi:hypothetical protein